MTDGRRLAHLGLLGALLLLCIGLSLWIGAHQMALHTVLRALRDGPESSGDALIVWDERIPRTVMALVIGAALGMGGALIQGHTRNPLADTGIIGSSAGAAFAVVVAIYFIHVASLAGYVWFALGGALVATVIVFAVSGIGRGGTRSLTLILAGTAVSAALLSATTAVSLLDADTLNAFRFWTAGSVAERPISVLWVIVPLLLLATVAALASAPALNLLAMGDDVAASLGLHVTRWRVIGLFTVALIGGACTAAAGPIGFVGFVVPHLVRGLVGVDYRWVMPCSAVAGAALLVAADTIGRVVALPGELQVGVVLAFIGAPFFILLVRRPGLVSV